MGTFFHRHRGVTPYLLLAPGILWLAIFFLIPLAFLGYESLQSGLFPNFQFTWEFSNFSNGIRDYHEQIVRSFMYAGIATVACLLLAYPLVYWIAFRAGPWRNLFLLFIVAPFFVTYLVRTLAWLNILADEGPVVGMLREHPRPRPRRPAAGDVVRGGLGDHLQLLPLHGASDLRLARADRSAPPRGGEGPLRDRRRRRSCA